MKIGIYAGVDVGEVKDKSIDYIGVDRGVAHLLTHNIKPLIAMGDMDSIDRLDLLEGLKVQSFPCVKNDTDTALAIDYALKLGYQEIDLYGVTQKRIDHFLAVLCLLESYQDISITIYDQNNKIFVLKPGKHRISKDGYDYFSLFSFEKSIVTLTHCHYPLDRYCLQRHDALCVSNQMDDDFVIVENTGTLLFVQST